MFLQQDSPNSTSGNKPQDTGMAMALICLLLGLWQDTPYWNRAGIVLLALTMTWPGIFKPVSLFWFRLSHVLGAVMSRLILGLLFYALVMPVGIARKCAGADALQLKKWKKNRTSVFRARNHVFTKNDLTKPY